MVKNMRKENFSLFALNYRTQTVKNHTQNYVQTIAFLTDICYNMLYNDIEVSFMTFADKVKFVRMKLYLSQAQLAKEIGVSFATVNRWESKGYEPQLASVGRFNDFCEKHGITFEEKGETHHG